MKFHMLIQIMKNQVMIKNLFFVKNFIVTIKTVNRGLSVSSVEGGLSNFVQELNVGKHSPASFAENVFYKLIFILFYCFMYFILTSNILFSDFYFKFLRLFEFLNF